MPRTEPAPEWKRGPAQAEAFESCAVPYLLAPWIGDLLEAAKIPPGARVLDAACGTGAVARAVARHAGPSGSVTGFDISPEMIAVARQASAGAAAAIRWEVSDAASLPFPDASFDVILCQQGLQFFTDRGRALREFRRVLAPGGLAALAVWGRLALNPYPSAMARSADRHLGADVGRQLRTAFALGDPGELRSLLVSAGLRSVSVRALAKTLTLPPLPEFIPRHFACTSVAPAFAAATPEVQSAIVTDMARDLHVTDSSREPAFHFEVNLALGR